MGRGQVEDLHLVDLPFVEPLLRRLAGCAPLCYTREELLETTVSDIHPAEMPELRAFFGEALRDGHASIARLTCRTKSGVFLPTEISLHVVDSGGRCYLLGLVQDRSQRPAGQATPA
jgi:hypothetical protein